MPLMQSQMELHPIFYISTLCIVIFFALVAWIQSTQAGKNWFIQLQRRNERLQKQNRTRQLPTQRLDPDRMSNLRREMRIQSINAHFDALRDSYNQVIKNPERLAELLEKLEKDRAAKLAQIDVAS
jgi:hypothetical protein